MKPNLFIATPTNGLVQHAYAGALAQLCVSLTTARVPFRHTFQEGSVVSEQRDRLAHLFLKDASFTHLLFIDSDMRFPPDLAQRLLGFGKDLIGAIYPARALDFGRLRTEVMSGKSFDQAHRIAQKLVLRADPGTTLGNGPASVKGVGMGFTLISRRCFEMIAEKCPPVTYKRLDSPGETFSGFFRELPPDNEGTMLNEDFAFCQRFRDAGGEVWAYLTPHIQHIGTFAYEMPFARA